MTNPKRNENEYNTCTPNFMQFQQPNIQTTEHFRSAPLRLCSDSRPTRICHSIRFAGPPRRSCSDTLRPQAPFRQQDQQHTCQIP